MNPLLPVKNRTAPFWLTERDASLATFVSSDELPAQAEIVILGSGISGALAAHYVYKELEKANKTYSVVMLEAADMCEGATARNGGHCKPLTYLGFQNEVVRYGAKAVNDMYTFEVAHLQRYVDLVKEEDLDCDLHVTRACDVFFTQEGAASAKKDFETRKRLFPESVAHDDIVPLEDVKELEDFSGTKGGYWGCHYPAGHLWPYKLSTQIIQKCIKRGMKVYTNTPADTLTTCPTTRKHTITTSTRGSIVATSVITTTNAFTAGLLPRFQNRIIPVRGTACSIQPAPSHSLGSLPGPLRLSYGLSNGNGAMDYMICRQGRGRVPGHGDKSYILGGAKAIFAHDLPSWYNNIRDDEQIPGAVEYFQLQMQRRMKDWRGEKKPGNVDMVWSGVLGYSNDLLPYVGEMPGRSGIFVSAGFTGHGMPRIPACSESAATLAVLHLNGALSAPAVESTLQGHIPTPYILTQTRLESNRNYILNLMGQEKEQPAEEVRANL